MLIQSFACKIFRHCSCPFSEPRMHQSQNFALQIGLELIVEIPPSPKKTCDDRETSVRFVGGLTPPLVEDDPHTGDWKFVSGGVEVPIQHGWRLAIILQWTNVQGSSKSQSSSKPIRNCFCNCNKHCHWNCCCFARLVYCVISADLRTTLKDVPVPVVIWLIWF